MMTSIFDPLNILLLAATVIILLRLRSTLGSRTGHRQKFDFRPRDRAAGGDNVITLPGKTATTGAGDESDEGTQEDKTVAGKPEHPVWEGFAELEADVAQGLADIAKADPQFAPQDFIEGAKSAYEMIVTAFAKADRETLNALLREDIRADFLSALDQREQAGQLLDSQLISIEDAALTGAALKGRLAQVTVAFSSRMIQVLRDGEGQVIEGDPRRIQHIRDTWTFERDTRNDDPNWLLTATQAAG